MEHNLSIYRLNLVLLLLFTLLLINRCDPSEEKRGEYEAIRKLHAAMDEDADGMVDINESKDFLEADLKYSKGSSDARHQAFHKRGTDDQIDVDELWHLWCESPVRNWTTEKVIEWLIEEVGHGEYAETFRVNLINGTHLPQIAVESGYLTSLNITSYLHKVKLKTKAKDAVLFGPPQRNGYLSREYFYLLISIAFACFCVALHFYNMMRKKEQEYQRNVDSFRKTESELFESLQKFEAQNKKLETHKCDLETQLQLQRQSSGSNLSCASGLKDDQSSSDGSSREFSGTTINELSAEVKRLEQALVQKKWTPSRRMLRLLLSCYNEETWLLRQWKEKIEQQAAMARAGLEKFQKVRSTAWGMFKVAQVAPAQESKDLMENAKKAVVALSEKYEERKLRWLQIQEECNFPLLEQ